MDLSRRSLFGLAAGAAVAPMVPGELLKPVGRRAMCSGSIARPSDGRAVLMGMEEIRWRNGLAATLETMEIKIDEIAILDRQ